MCYSLWVKRLSMSTGSATTLPVSWRSSSQALYQALLTNAAFNRIDTLRETDDKFPYGFLPHLQCSYIYITCNITYNIIKYYVQYDIAYIQRVAHCARVCPYAVCWSQCFWSNTWIQWWWYPVWTLSRTATSLGPWKLPWLQVAQPFWLLSIGSSLSSRTWHCSCHHTSLRLESAREMLQPTWWLFHCSWPLPLPHPGLWYLHPSMHYSSQSGLFQLFTPTYTSMIMLHVCSLQVCRLVWVMA